MQADAITVDGDVQAGDALIEPVMRAGRRLRPPEPLAGLRERASRQLAQLPPHLRDLGTQPAYPVRITPAIERLADEADDAITDS